MVPVRSPTHPQTVPALRIQVVQVYRCGADVGRLLFCLDSLVPQLVTLF